MPNYGEKVSATRPRVRKVIIDRELYQPSKITYKLHEVTEVNGVLTAEKDLTDLVVEQLDYSTQIPVRNPDTGEVTGRTVTIGEAAAIVFSLGWYHMERAGI